MKTLFKILSVLACVALVSCVGRKGDPIVPSSFVRLSIVNTPVNIDNGEKAQFVVTADGVDVTDQAIIVNTTGGELDTLKNAEGGYLTEYEPTQLAVHTFVAIYQNSRSTETAFRPISGQQSGTFYRRSAVYKFTGTWCKYCPEMGHRIEDVVKMRPDRLVEVGVHNNDVLTIEMGTKLGAYAQAELLPEVMVDYRKETKFGTRTVLAITSEIDNSIAMNPTIAGIKMSVAEQGGKLQIQTETKVAKDGQYKLVVAVLMDDFDYPQTGASDASYRQNHVLREYLCSDMMGDDLGQIANGGVAAKSYSYDLLPGIDITRYRVVALVQNQMPDGQFRTNNIVQCNIGQTVDYEYEYLNQN